MGSLVHRVGRRLSVSVAVRTSPTFAGWNNHDDDNEKQQDIRGLALTMRMRSRPRKYHSSARKEILPFLAVGVIGVSAVYTYRALQQMDQDWEKYYEALDEYKSITGIDPEHDGRGDNNASVSNTDNIDLSSLFTGGSLAVDMGTTRLKLSHRPTRTKQQNGKPPSPTVSIDREGHRSTPSLAWVPPSNVGEEKLLVGRLAEARSYDTKGGTIIYPREELARDNKSEAAVRELIREVATNALDQVLGNNGGFSTQSETPLFVLDASMSKGAGSGYNVRPIFTYLPPDKHSTDSNLYLEQYQHVVNGLTSPRGIAAFIPEPVAAVAGAEYYNLLPPKNTSSGTAVLVIGTFLFHVRHFLSRSYTVNANLTHCHQDVGGKSTCLSMVDDNTGVLHSTTLSSFGGDTFIDLLVCHLVEDFYGNSDSGNSSEALSSKPRLNDPMALQRLYEASTNAIHELSKKSRCQIEIPYLTINLETRKPRHLDVGMARTVVEAKVETWVQKKLIPYLQNCETRAMVLSQSLKPTNLSSLFSSAIMSSLEQTSHSPFMLRAILVVGGGARIPLIKNAIEESVGHLGGERNRLIMPAGEMTAELTALGAAVRGSTTNAI